MTISMINLLCSEANRQLCYVFLTTFKQTTIGNLPNQLVTNSLN